ncbi:sensor histidine kinase [Embleya sp. NBC_00896]|uniref:sensor histidine kinase n=1 Tax=Embleya sp. NBC_00896 TaxID=2975961 RepID=UPI003863A3C9|nr:sensor histidine kinase [Embleya sp. NBC_00896]
MHHLYAWLRRRPLLVDGAWALLLLMFGLFEVIIDQPGTPDVPHLIALSAMSVVLLIRRRNPTPALVLTIVIGVFQLFDDIPPGAEALAMPAIAYSAAAYSPRWASRTALVGGVLAPIAAVVRWWDEPDVGVTGVTLFTLLLMGPFVIAWVLGDSVRTRRAYYAELEDRADRLERERDQQAQIAAASERARIARELHDVVAHNVSVMVVQADGAAYALDSAPELTREALGTISATGREALAEMRRLLGVLRSQGEGGAYVPQPGVEQLEDLLDRVRNAGLPVDLKVEGVPVELPQGVALTVYRIVQEALTNTRKHGGPNVTALVNLRYVGEDVELDVGDDGRGAAAPGDGMGHGLVGMSERVALFGGCLETGPRPGGGWRVHARLPVRPRVDGP